VKATTHNNNAVKGKAAYFAAKPTLKAAYGVKAKSPQNVSMKVPRG
jgi:hypothetical protein